MIVLGMEALDQVGPAAVVPPSQGGILPPGSLLYASLAQPDDDYHTDAYGRPPTAGGHVYQLTDVEDVYGVNRGQVSQFPSGDLCVAAGGFVAPATTRRAIRVDPTTDPPTFTIFIADLLAGGLTGQLVRAEMDASGRLIEVLWQPGASTTARRYNADGTVEATYSLAVNPNAFAPAAAISHDGQYVYLATANAPSSPPTMTVTRYDLDAAAASSTFLTQTLTTSPWGSGRPGAALGVSWADGSVFVGYPLHTFVGSPTNQQQYAFWIDHRDAAGTLVSQIHVSSLDYNDSGVVGTYEPFVGFLAALTYDAFDGVDRLWGWAFDIAHATEFVKVLDLPIGGAVVLHDYIAGPSPSPGRANLFVPIWPYTAGQAFPGLGRTLGKDQAFAYGPPL